MAKQNVLPIAQPPPAPVSVLHTKYLVSLLGPDDEDPDNPFYAGDIYNQTLPKAPVTKEAEQWRKET